MQCIHLNLKIESILISSHVQRLSRAAGRVGAKRLALRVLGIHPNLHAFLLVQ